MHATDTKRLNDWLLAKGCTPLEAIKCNAYIATGDTVHLPKTVKHKIKIKKKSLSAKLGTLNR